MRDRDSGRDSSGEVRNVSRVDRFHQLFDGMSDSAYLVETITGRILACNDAAVEQTGYSRGELIGLDIGRDLNEEELPVAPAIVHGAMASGEGFRFVDQKRRKDGTTYWDEIVLVPFRTDGEAVHVSINRDISSRAAKEAELRESEARYRSIFESTTDAVIVEANPNAYGMYGYEPGELLGVPANKVIHSDYFHGFSNFRTAIDGQGHFRARSVNLRKDGSPFDVEVHGGRFSYQGSPHLLSIVRDIREQVAAEKSLEKARLKVERLHEAATQLANATSEANVYAIAVESAQEILDFNLCGALVVEDGKLIVLASSEGWPPEALTPSDLDEGSIALTTYQSEKTVVFGSPADVPEARSTLNGFRSGISSPIGSFGVFQVVSRDSQAFSEQDVRFLELLLRHTAQAIERINLQDTLVMQANHDPLTGVYNRRYFNQVIEQELARSKRYERTIGFLMIDVNRFKEINDRFGHQMGDEVLKSVADLLKDAVRESDLVVRYGGDEFLVVLMETEGECASIVERIERSVRARNSTNELVHFPVTLSIGTASWKPSDNDSIEEVLAEADRRMYEAKRQLNGE
jgi:diguanylate cyclase (GGDEF)-like protein/PAS domain S-box-containing protein